MGQNATTKRSTSSEPGSMGLYLRELRAIPRMTSEEEQDCARLAAQGDESARQRLIQANLRFVIMVARRYHACGVPLEDLVNEGNIGLIQAARRFDPERGIRFVSYAVHWIRQTIVKAIQVNGGVIRVPRSRPSERTRLAAQAARRVISLDSPVAGTEDADPLSACLEDRSATKPEEVLADASLKEGLGTALAGLSRREAGILQDRFGLDGRRPISLLEIGAKHGLSKERVRQIEKRALRRIRTSHGAWQLVALAT
jgi:RNA polymerase primary sigma factor